ncbi:hypothetical protein ACAG25_08865 [Mycobacterium sp. pV006]|uniref:hypothetical protein n=1 Tax=Mycobacterium sp. pV006 TaxID=3238983 RepID=UPI00351BAE07
MAENMDVAGRLADGQPAIANLEQYLWAARQVGYGHPDLTLHVGQLRNWYSSEDGMDLAVLAGDAAALGAVTSACHAASAVQDRQLGALPAAWSGSGAQACLEFLRGHGAASADVTAAVRAAADALTEAVEVLWGLVDAKVGAVVEVEGRTADSRERWLSAAAALTTGGGDRAAAVEVVEHAVKPFAENVIQAEVLTTLRDTTAAIGDTYRAVTAEVASGRIPSFAVPGELGPTVAAACVEERVCAEPAAAGSAAAAPPPAAPVTMAAAPSPAPVSAAAAPVVPAAAAPPLGVAPSSAPPAELSGPPAETPLPPPPPAPMPAAAPPPSALGSPGGDFGGGLSGLGQQFSDTLRGLLGGGSGGFDAPDLEPPDLDQPELGEVDPDEPDLDDPEADDEAESDEDPDPEAGAETGDELIAPADAGPPPAEDCAPADADVALDAAATPAPEAAPSVTEPAPPVQPLPPAEPAAAEQTPCEIAEGEVPQVGEPAG